MPKKDIELMVKHADAAKEPASIQLTAYETANFDAKYKLLESQFNNNKSDDNEL